MNRMKRVFLAITAFLLIFIPAFAFDSVKQARAPLSLQQCLDMAVKYSGELAVQNEKRNEASQKVRQSRGGILPSVDFIYQKTYRDTAGGLYTTDLTDSKFSMTQPLFQGFSKASAYTIAGNDLRKEDLNYESARRALKAAVTQAFYSLAQIDGDIVNIENTRTAMATRRSELQERARLGKSRESEVLMIESQIATLAAQEEKSLSDRAVAAEELAYLTGSGSQMIAIVDDTPAPAAQAAGIDTYITAVKTRSDVAALQKDVESQKLKLRAARGSLLPTLDLNGAFYTQKSGTTNADSKWDAALVLNAPLFRGGANLGKAAEEAARLREYEANLDLYLREIVTQTKQLYRAADSSIKQATAYKDAFDKAERSYRMQLSDYKYGLVSNLDVIQAMLTVLDVKKNYGRALIQSKIDRAMLEIAAGS